ncbi:hypothetical protein PO124_30310 [Bacillus licheniformis]|nr:hypothetical protein [Bacillus licheniformis]
MLTPRLPSSSSSPAGKSVQSSRRGLHFIPGADDAGTIAGLRKVYPGRSTCWPAHTPLFTDSFRTGD